MNDETSRAGRAGVDAASTATAQPAYRLLATPTLPDTDAGYRRRHREPADPIGLRGLRNWRVGLNNELADLCDRLIGAGGQTLRGRQLATEMDLTGTRALRLLVAYGHVHHRLRQIVGVPGDGYVWGPARPAVYAEMTAHARQMGRCWLFNATLYGRRSAVVEAAQLAFDWVGGLPGDPDRKPRSDELAGLMASEGVGVEELLEAMVTRLSRTDHGRKVLGRVGSRHASLMVPADAFAELAARVRGCADGLADLAAGQSRPGTPVGAAPGGPRNPSEAAACKPR